MVNRETVLEYCRQRQRVDLYAKEGRAPQTKKKEQARAAFYKDPLI